MQRQAEAGQTRAHHLQEAPSFSLVFEANNNVVGIPHDHDGPPSMALPPLVRPEVEDEVQVNVRQ